MNKRRNPICSLLSERFQIGLFAVLVGLLFFSSAQAQSAPPAPSGIDAGIKLGDMAKALIVWSWSQGTGPAANGFRIYCGLSTNNYIYVQDVPDVTARSYSLLAASNGDGEKNCDSGECLYRPWCTVVAYNQFGESRDDQPLGAPRDIDWIRYEMMP